MGSPIGLVLLLLRQVLGGRLGKATGSVARRAGSQSRLGEQFGAGY